MSLTEDELLNEFNQLFDQVRHQFQPPLSDEGLAEELGFSKATLRRMRLTIKSGIDPKTRYENLRKRIKLLKALLNPELQAAPKSAQRKLKPKPSTTAGNFHEFKIYYCNWTTSTANTYSPGSGSVVTGHLRLPVHWKGKGSTLTLHDGIESKGTTWAQQYKPGRYHLSARFYRAGHPDLFLTLHIYDEKHISLLVGAFATADADRYSPLHGTVYLRLQPKPVPEQAGEAPVNSLDTASANQPEQQNKQEEAEAAREQEIDLKIRQALFQQTFVQKDRQPLPEFVNGSYKTLIDNLLNKTFVGYFIHTQKETLENFKARVDADGRVTIVYHNGKIDRGQFRSYHEKIIWFAFDYDQEWKLHRYRMHFWKHTQQGWYLGIGSGSETAGVQVFMNRVAMFETIDEWNLDKLRIDVPIQLNAENQARLNNLFALYPTIKNYLSGVPSDDIVNNERLSETPYLLEKAGFLTNSRAKSAALTGSNPKVITGDYVLYSLSRSAELTETDEENETFSVVKLPLRIKNDGTAELKGKGRTYYGSAFYEGSKLILYFNQRKWDDRDTRESAFLSFYVKVQFSNDGSKPKKYSIGVSNRFTDELPEARTEVLIKIDGTFENEQFESFKFFSTEWIKFNEEKQNISRYISGRLNRLIVLHHNIDTKPEKRQDEFRQLYAHTASSFLKDTQAEEFVQSFYQAVLHSFGQDSADEKLYDQLVERFRQIYLVNAGRWKIGIFEKAKALHNYLIVSSEKYQEIVLSETYQEKYGKSPGTETEVSA